MPFDPSSATKFLASESEAMGGFDPSSAKPYKQDFSKENLDIGLETMKGLGRAAINAPAALAYGLGGAISGAANRLPLSDIANIQSETQAQAPQIKPSSPMQETIDKGLADAYHYVREGVGSGAVTLQEAIKKIKPRLGLGMGGLFVTLLENSSEEAVRSAAEGATDFATFASMLVHPAGPPKAKSASAKDTLISDSLGEASLRNQQMGEEALFKKTVAEQQATQEFRGAQQQDLPFEQQTKFGPARSEGMTFDPQSAHPFDAARSEEFAATERGNIPAQQGDLFQGNSIEVPFVGRPDPSTIPPSGKPGLPSMRPEIPERPTAPLAESGKPTGQEGSPNLGFPAETAEQKFNRVYTSPSGRFGGKQGGVIDMDLLTLGVSSLIEKLGNRATIEKFKGTYHPERVEEMLKRASIPAYGTSLVWMEPSKFHELAQKRFQEMPAIGDKRPLYEANSEVKRESIREGLKTTEGLDDIPTIILSKIGDTYRVVGHEGRHRMDVFKEQGLDKVLVRVENQDRKATDFPKWVIGENATGSMFPERIPVSELKGPNTGKFGQGGAVNFGFSEAVAKAWDSLHEELKKVQINTPKLRGAIKTLSEKPDNVEAAMEVYSELLNGKYSDKAQEAAWDLANALSARIQESPKETAKIYKFPSGERGMVDPSVFLEGLSRMLGRTPKTLEGAKGILEAKLEKAMSTRDTFMAPAYREKLKELEQLQATEKKQRAPKTFGPEVGALLEKKPEPYSTRLTMEDPNFKIDHLTPADTQHGKHQWNIKDKETGEIVDAFDTKKEAEAWLLRSQSKEVSVQQIPEGVTGKKRDPETGKLIHGPRDTSFKNVSKMEKERPLVEAAVGGDIKAFETLFEKARLSLDKLGRSKNLDKATIEDLIQDTAEGAFEKISTFDPQASFSSWLSSIFIHKYINSLKAKGRFREVPDFEAMEEGLEGRSEVFDNPANILQTQQYKEGINRAWERLDKFNQTERMVLELKDLEGIDYPQISKLISTPEKTFSLDNLRQIVKRARDHLKDFITEESNRGQISSAGPRGRQRGATTPDFLTGGVASLIKKNFFKEAKKSGFPLAVKKMRDQFDLSPPDLGDVIKENPDAFKKENLRDLGPVGDRIMAETAIDKQMSILTENSGGLGKIIKWVVDWNKEIKRKSDLQITELIAKSTGPGSSWAKMKKAGNYGHAQLRSLTDKIIENIGKDLNREDFRSDTEYNAYKEMADTRETTRQAVNTARAKFPSLKPIVKLPGHFPATWEGDYFIVAQNKAGETVHMFSSHSMNEANAVGELWQKAHPDMKIEGRVRGENKFGIKDLSAFETAMNLLDGNSKEYQILNKTLVDILSKRSFGRHAAHKTGVEGFMGSEAGKLGVENLRRAHDQYIKQAHNYIANLDRQALREELGRLDPAIKKEIPRGLAYLDNYISQAKGESLKYQEKIVQTVAEWISHDVLGTVGLGQGKSGPQRAVNNISAIASVFWLATPRFYLSNLPQSLMSYPKMTEIAGRDPLARSPMHSMLEGLNQAARMNDPVSREAANWALKNGYLESALVEMLHLNMHDVARSKIGAIGEGFKWSQQKWERHVVRVPSLLAFEYQLRDSVPNKEARFRRAAEQMDNYMVHYDRQSSPLVYQRLGLLGDVARPLKQYPHNAYGQTFEMMQVAKDHKRYKPLATLLGIQAAVSGLRGVMFVAEAALFISAVNMIFGSELPSPEEFLLGKRKQLTDHWPNSKVAGVIGDAMVYGGLSTALNADVSSSVNAPGIVSLFSAPPAQFATNMIVDNAVYTDKYFRGLLTPADKMAWAIANSPNAVRGFWEEFYTIEGQPTPRSQDEMKGNFRRTDYGHWLANVLSLKTIPNAVADDQARILKNLMARDAKEKMSAIHAIIGQVRENKQIDPELIQMYVEEGGDPKNLQRAIIEGLKDQSLTFEERQLQGSMTPAKIKRLRRMMEIYQMDSGKNEEDGAKHQIRSEKDIQGFGDTLNHPLAKAMVKKSYPKDMEKFYQQSKKEDPNSNLSKAFSMFVPDKMDVREHPLDLNFLGTVYDRMPETAFVGKNSPLGTTPHEISHIGQNTNPNVNVQPTLMDLVNIEEKNKIYNGAMSKIRGIVKNDKETGNWPSNMGRGLDEAGASFVGKESSLKSGQTVWDLPEIKKLNFTKQEKKLIEKWMFTHHDKMNEGDDFSPEKIPEGKSMIKTMRSKIRNYTAR